MKKSSEECETSKVIQPKKRHQRGNAPFQYYTMALQKNHHYFHEVWVDTRRLGGSLRNYCSQVDCRELQRLGGLRWSRLLRRVPFFTCRDEKFAIHRWGVRAIEGNALGNGRKDHWEGEGFSSRGPHWEPQVCAFSSGVGVRENRGTVNAKDISLRHRSITC